MPEEVHPVPNCRDGLPSPWVTPFSPDTGAVYYPLVVIHTEQKLRWGHLGKFNMQPLEEIISLLPLKSPLSTSLKRVSTPNMM